MQGVLFKYGPGSAQTAFICQQCRNGCSAVVATHVNYLVLVGGLTDGLLFAPYCQQLVEECGWTVVQAQLTSSYQGWGLASLDQDAAELRLLSDCLAADHKCSSWVLMGHSTGCQDAVRYVQKYRATDRRLAGVILQAPVSDREYFSLYPSWSQHIKAAQELVAQGKGEEVVCRATEWDGAAVTARRLVSLACAGGDDDMFSTDLSLQQLRDILGPLHGLPTLILQSGADEVVPQELKDNGSTTAFGQRMLQAIIQGSNSSSNTMDTGTAAAAAGAAGGAVGVKHPVESLVQLHVIDEAGHACKGHEQQLTELVSDFLQQLTRKP